MIKTPFRKAVVIYLVSIILAVIVLSIVAYYTIAYNLPLWPAVAVWGIVFTLSAIHIVFGYFVIYRRFNQIVEEQNERSREMATILEAHKEYIERRLRNLLEVQLALSLDDFAKDPEVSGETEDLLKYAQQRRQKYVQDVHFVLLQEQSRLREIYLAELFDGIEKVWLPIGAINEETGHANHVDLLYVSAIARHLQCRNLFEFGTYMGQTSYHLTYASEGARVITLNLPSEADPRVAPYLGTYSHGTDREPFIEQIYCDSREFDTTPYGHKMDFIFVDGDHSYELVKNDTYKAFEMLAPGGVIIWHDYAAKSPGLVEFFREFTQKQPLFRIRNTCLLVHLDGVDPTTFSPYKMHPSLEAELRDKSHHDYHLFYHL